MLLGGAVAGLDELHDGDGGEGWRRGPGWSWLAGWRSPPARCRSRPVLRVQEELFDQPPAAIKVEHAAGLQPGCRGYAWSTVASVPAHPPPGRWSRAHRADAAAPSRGRQIGCAAPWRGLRNSTAAKRTASSPCGPRAPVRRDRHRKAALLWQAVEEGEQRPLHPHRAVGFPVLAGAQDQIDVGRRRREVLVDVALAIRHAGDVACRTKTAAARLVASSQRCNSFSAVWRARRARLCPRRFHRGIDETQQRTGCSVHRQNGMQQQTARPSALADRAEAVGLRPPTTQDQLAGVLDRHHLPAGDPGRRPAAACADISAGVTARLCKNRVNCIWRARLPASRRMQDGRRSTIAACNSAPLFPGGGRQTAPDRTRSRSSCPPNR